MAEPLPGYAGPVAKGLIGGGLLGAALGFAFAWVANRSTDQFQNQSFIMWSTVAAVCGAVQGASHLALLRHRLRQEMIHGADHEHEH